MGFAGFVPRAPFAVGGYRRRLAASAADRNPNKKRRPGVRPPFKSTLKCSCDAYCARSVVTKRAWRTTLILVPAILLSHFWVPLAHVAWVGPIIDKLIDLILAFFLFKGLNRESTRYRQALAAAGQPL